MVAVITGLGTAVPGASIPTELFIEHAKEFSCRNPRQERILEELYRRTEISSRASVLASYGYGDRGEKVFSKPKSEDDMGPGTAARMQCYAQEAGALAIASSRKALADAGVEPEQITHLVTVSCTGFYAPGFDIELIDQLPLRRNTARTHVGFMGCHGAMNALRVACAYAEADKNAIVLLCTSELCSLHFQYGWSTNKLVANSLFSDGSAAVVVRSSTNASNVNCWNYRTSNSFVIPDTTDAMMWRIGDHGFQMGLSSRVPEIVSEWLPDLLSGWLHQHQLNLPDIAGWAVHPGGPRILDAVEQCMSLPADALQFSRSVLAECGNMSSPTILFILERMRSAQLFGPCVVLGFGPGVTIESMLLDLVNSDGRQQIKEATHSAASAHENASLPIN